MKEKPNQVDNQEKQSVKYSLEDYCGEYKDVGGHHIHAKSAFFDDVHYNPRKGFCIGHKAIQILRLDHESMTSEQRRLFAELYGSGRENTLDEHTRIAKLALIAGGVSELDADYLITMSLQNLAKQGVVEPSRIPWFTPKK